ncbi:circadian clock-controlled protein daywake-like [Cochliomyia hominivorax]
MRLIFNIFIVLSSFNILVIYAVESLVTEAAFKDIPNCSAKDENINECLLRVVAEMIPRSKNGIPELNIPAMDPFVVNKTTYIFSHPLVQGKVSVRNAKIYGFSKMKTTNLDYKRQGDKMFVKVKSHVPDLYVEGMYKAKIKVNNANIASRGSFNVTFDDIDVAIDMKFDLYEKDGHRYMRLKSYNFDPTVGNMKFYAGGLLPEPLLNDALLEFINENWRPIYKTLIPETRAAWEPEIIKLATEYFSHIPVDAVIKDE